MLTEYFPKQWREYVDLDYLKSIEEALEQEQQNWHPAPSKVFSALELTSPADLLVVQLGMDPYPTKGVPNGLAFSVNPGQPIPKSLVNIFKEYHNDLGYPIPAEGDLTPWAKQGVLLLNSALTVSIGEAGSHMKEWEPFSKYLLQQIASRKEGLVWVLLGANAQKRIEDIDLSKHHLIKAPHPSPLSAYRGFFGSKIFSRTNKYLSSQGKQPINWRLT